MTKQSTTPMLDYLEQLILTEWLKLYKDQRKDKGKGRFPCLNIATKMPNKYHFLVIQKP